MESGQELNLPNVEKKETREARDGGTSGGETGDGEMKMPNTAMMRPEKSGAKKGMIAGLVCLALLAVAGCAFGAYGMLTKDSEIAKVKAECAGVDTNVDADTKEETAVVTCLDGSDNSEPIAESDLLVIDNLHFVGDVGTGRRYYLATNDLDKSKDSRQVNMYLVDTTALGTASGVVAYDMSGILDAAVEAKMASLPDILAEGTVNEMPKSKCDSVRVKVGDVVENPRNLDWTIVADWSSMVPLTIYYACEINDGNIIEMSLGTSAYSLNPGSGELVTIFDKWN